MAFTEEQQQRIATKKLEAARRRAASERRRSSKQVSVPASAITQEQRKRSEENKRRALEMLNKRASQRSALALRDRSKPSSLPASAVKIVSRSTPLGQASSLTEHQQQRMEHNRRLALERRKNGAKKGDVAQSPTTMRSAQHVVSSTAMPPRPITDLQRRRMESNRLAALEKRKKRANNGFVTPSPSTSRSQYSVPTACKRPKIAAEPFYCNGSILKIKGVHFRQTDVAIGDAVHLVREPHNVSLYPFF